MVEVKTGLPSWFYRRVVIFGALVFCAFIVTLIILLGVDTRTADTAVTGAFFLAFSVIGSYVFGAVWDDKNVLKHVGPSAFAPKPEEPAPAPYSPDPSTLPPANWNQ